MRHFQNFVLLSRRKWKEQNALHAVVCNCYVFRRRIVCRDTSLV